MFNRLLNLLYAQVQHVGVLLLDHGLFALHLDLFLFKDQDRLHHSVLEADQLGGFTNVIPILNAPLLVLTLLEVLITRAQLALQVLELFLPELICPTSNSAPRRKLIVYLMC